MPKRWRRSYLMLTKDKRFAYLDRVIGGRGVYAADEWGPDRAMRFLMQHGEGDIVDEFPDIFRKRTVASPVAKVKKIVPRRRTVPPSRYCFPCSSRAIAHRHCERSEAIQGRYPTAIDKALDCFAPLAMTII